jgi:hypothetical protein
MWRQCETEVTQAECLRGPISKDTQHKYSLFPICEHDHWQLLLFIIDPTTNPLTFLFDSHSTTRFGVSNIDNLSSFAYGFINTINSPNRSNFNGIIIAATPQQTNVWDCGFFVIRNLSILLNLTQDQLTSAITNSQFDFQNMYTKEDMEDDRVSAFNWLIGYARRYRETYSELFPGNESTTTVPPTLSPRNKTKKNKNKKSNQHPPMTGMTQNRNYLCKFDELQSAPLDSLPPNVTAGQNISNSEYIGLQPEQLLTDMNILILKTQTLQNLHLCDPNRVNLFDIWNPLTYTLWSQWKTEVSRTEWWQTLTQKEGNHTYFLFPICEKGHWQLLFITNPTTNPRTFLFDSSTKGGVSNLENLSSFANGFINWFNNSNNLNFIEISLADTPQQTNAFDCGFFLIQNLSILLNLTMFHVNVAIDNNYFDFRNVYTKEDMEENRRKALRWLIGYARKYRETYSELFPRNNEN